MLILVSPDAFCIILEYIFSLLTYRAMITSEPVMMSMCGFTPRIEVGDGVRRHIDYTAEFTAVNYIPPKVTEEVYRLDNDKLIAVIKYDILNGKLKAVEDHDYELGKPNKPIVTKSNP